MPRCPECGHSFREEKITLVEPIDTDYIDNALNIAEYYSGERNWDFYKLPYFKFRAAMDEWFSSKFPPPPSNDKPAKKRWSSKKASYFEFTEARMAYGLNFCARKGSAYKELKRRLTDRVDKDGIDENGDFEPFSLKQEFYRIQDELQDEGFSREERNDMFTGFLKGESAVARILLLNVEGAENYLSISKCDVSNYFPELKKEETDEKSELSK